MIAIAAGADHSLALKGDGTVVAWGYNFYGETTVPSGLSNVIAVAAGNSRSLAINRDGTVVAWGYNCCGLTNVPSGLSNVVAIAAGGQHNLVILGSTQVGDWVVEWDGEGDLQTVPVAGQNGVVAIAAGGFHSVALKNDGSVVAWGGYDDEDGFNGIGVPDGVSGVTAIAAGGSGTVALVIPSAATITTQPISQTVDAGQSANFTVGATGFPLYYQWRKDGVDIAEATSASYRPTVSQTNQAGSYTVTVGNLKSVTSAPAVLTVIAVPPAIVTQPINQTVNLRRTAEFKVAATGYSLNYQWRKDGVDILGARSPTYSLTVVAQTNQAGNYAVVVSNPFGSVTSITATLTVNFVAASGDVVAWGDNYSGQTTVPAAAQSEVMAIAAGNAHTVALKNNGSVLAWGDNYSGQTTVPAAAQSGVVAIAAGYLHTVVLKDDGSVVTWGAGINNTGFWPNLGQSSVPVAAQSGVVAIAAGGFHTVALMSDGSVVAWGDNRSGQTTVPVAAQSGVMAIAAGLDRSVALKNDGSVVAWGDNTYGETTVPAAAQSGVMAIAAGNYHTVALKIDGSVVAWGANWAGHAPPEGLSGVTAIAAGSSHTVALVGDGAPALPVPPVGDGRPHITVQPWNRQVADGDNLRLVVIAVGQGGRDAMHFQWQRNGVDVPGATNNVLDIVNAQMEQGGDYRVIVANALGAVTSQVARLEVLLRPRLQPLPPVVVVTNGGMLVITAEILAGTPPLQYQWRKNGANIPGATSPTLTITNTMVSDGGTYTLVVKNPVAVTVSDPMVLVVLVPATLAGDDFASRITLTGTNGQVAGTNIFATREPEEPLHAGKGGSNSVWYTWRPPANGIARFNTVGSVFDTLLAVYAGASLTNLAEVASDEDRGSYYTSDLRFNAQTNIEYQIALDGFAGQSGYFVLTWEMEATEETIPVVTLPSVGQTVLPGTNVLFTAQAAGSGLTYQWLFNGGAVAGATSSTLLLSNVQPADVGFYSVRVRNSFGREAESLPAALEIASSPRPLSQDKLEDLYLGIPGGGGFVPASVVLSLSLGSIDYQIVNNTGSGTQQREPVHCSTIGNATRWLKLISTASGWLSIDTYGSAIATVLAVYTNGATAFDKPQVACSEGGSGGSRVRFSAVANREYLVLADGANRAEGIIRLNSTFGIPPTASTNSQPPRHPFTPGQNLTLRSPTTNGIPPPRFQWFWNNQALVWQTNAWLSLVGLQGTNSGYYSVIVSNGLGEVIHTTEVSMEQPIVLTVEPQLQQGHLRLHLPAVPAVTNALGAVTRPVVWIETTSNLGDPASWRAIYLHTNTASPIVWAAPATNVLQFYRARRLP